MEVTTRTSQLLKGELPSQDIEDNIARFEKFSKYITHLTIEVSSEAKDTHSHNKLFKATIWVHGFKRQYQTTAKSPLAKSALDEACKDMQRLLSTEKAKHHTHRKNGGRKIKQDHIDALD
jgi:ribosome-associated translation inhibitor RaiA